MSPVGDAGLEQILARLIELEAHLDGQDIRLDDLRIALTDLHIEVRVLRRDIRNHWPGTSRLFDQDEPPPAA